MQVYGAQGAQRYMEDFERLCLYIELYGLDDISDGGSLSGKSNDDSNLAKGWYKFDVTGTKNYLPTFKHGIQ